MKKLNIKRTTTGRTFLLDRIMIGPKLSPSPLVLLLCAILLDYHFADETDQYDPHYVIDDTIDSSLENYSDPRKLRNFYST